MSRFPSYKRPIEYINGKAYIIYAIYPIERIKDAPAVKEWLGCDTAFKHNKQGTYIFCQEIEDAKYESI